MKHFKILVGAFAVLMAMNTGTASATKLYGNGATVLGAGTLFSAGLAAGTSTSISTSEGALLNTCTGSSLSGSIVNAGGALERVKIGVSSFSFTGCKTTVDVEERGELEVSHISGTTNGTLTGVGILIRVDTNLFGSTITCRYRTGTQILTGIDLGTLTGSTTANATMDVNATLTKVETSNFLCPSSANWVATYSVSSPSKLYVEAS